MTRWLAAAFVIALTACSSGETASKSSPAPSPRPSPTPIAVVTQGCGETPVLEGGRPDWLESAGAHNNPNNVPFVIAKPAVAAGFLFGNPLTVGRSSPSNKILWVVGFPRNGSALDVTVNPADSPTPKLTFSFPADSGPGEIYPSVVDVPAPGCWYFDLRWAGHEAGLQLRYA